MTSRPGPDSCPGHAVLVYGSAEDLRDRAVPYLGAGLDSGEMVVGVVPGPTADALHAGLGARAGSVRWGLPGLTYGHLGRATEVLHAFAERQHAAGIPTRLLVENTSVSGNAGRTAAYLRSDAAATELLGGYGLRWACLFSQSRYPPEVLADARAIHPLFIGPDGREAGSPGYVPPTAYLAAHPGPLSEVPRRTALEIELADPEDLPGARNRVVDTVRALGLPPSDCTGAELAAGEVIANAFRHGSAPCRVRVWENDGAVLIRVDDAGNGTLDGFRVSTEGFRPPDMWAGAGAGLWVARRAADAVQVADGPAGTSVELRFPLA